MAVSVLWLLLTVPWVGLLCVIVVFPDHKLLCYVSFAFNGVLCPIEFELIGTRLLSNCLSHFVCVF